MKIDTAKLLAAFKASPTLFLKFLGLIVKNPTLVTDLIAAEKTGQWVPFLETHMALLLPFMDTVVQAMEADPTLTNEILSALVSGVASATGAA